MKNSGLFIISAVLLILSCGCDSGNKLTPEKASDYLGKLYNKNFTLTESLGENGNVYYTFTDDDGIQCHFVLETYNFPSDDKTMPDTYYTITEDYQVMYMKSHPETYQALSEIDKNMTPVSNEGKNKINSVRFTISYNRYEDIEDIANKTVDAISSVPKLTPAENIADSLGVCSECAVVDFYCPYLSENSDISVYFPMINKYIEIQSAENIISQLQESFTKEGVTYDDSWQKSSDFSTIPESYKSEYVQPYDPDEHRQEQQINTENYDYGYDDYGYGYDDYDDYGYYGDY